MATNNAVNNSLTSQTGTGNFVGSTSPTLTTPKIVTQINDSNGNAIVGLGATGSAVNYLTITNQATGTPPFLSSSGTDTNIPINLQSKGDSPINFLTTALTNPFTIVSGTAGQHVTSFSFSNTSASRSVTYPDLTGTVALSGASQNVSFNVVQTAQINDTNNNQIIGFLPVASAVNTIQISNANAGGQCNINTAGADTNINMVLQPKGTGFLRYYTQATSNQLTVNTGTSYVHETLFQFPNTSASQSVTFPDLTGTVQLSSNTGTAGQVLTSNGAGVAPSYQNAAGGTDAAFGFLLMGG